MSYFVVPRCDVNLCTHHREGNTCNFNRTSIECWDLPVFATISTEVCEAHRQIDVWKLTQLIEGK